MHNFLLKSCYKLLHQLETFLIPPPPPGHTHTYIYILIPTKYKIRVSNKVLKGDYGISYKFTVMTSVFLHLYEPPKLDIGSTLIDRYLIYFMIDFAENPNLTSLFALD